MIFNGPPKLITKSSDLELKIVWDDDNISIYSFRNLRFSCLCARCRDEITGKKLIQLENISTNLKVTNAQLVGNYAVHFSFSDGHDTGIYSFEYLRKLVTS